MNFEFKRKRLNEISKAVIFDELEKVAKYFNYIEFSWRDFDKVSNISIGTIKKHFWSWGKWFNEFKIYLEEKWLTISPRPYSFNRVYSDKELFDEMWRIWEKVWQRPSRNEWEMSEPRIAYWTYKNRFGWWVEACSKFIEYKMKDEILKDDFIISDINLDKVKTNTKVEYKIENSRNISLSLRLSILNRDNFRCVFCWRSPATDLGTKLHIDHIIPFSKGWKSVLENLQTLCADCNLWKSNNEKIKL